MSTATSTRRPEGRIGIERASRTTVCVERDPRDPRGRVSVRTRTTGGEGRPRLRPVLLSSSATTARVCLLPEGALLIAGDEVEIRVDVGAGAELELVEPAGTVAYEMRGGSARWDVEARVGAGGSLVWGGEPFVVASGADVRRTTRVDLAADACLLLRETLVLGRHGEGPGRMAQRLDVVGPAGSAILVEELTIDGQSMPGILGGHRVLSSVLAIGLAVPAGTAVVGRYDLQTAGTWWRALGRDVHAVVPQEAWDAALRVSRG